MALVARSFFVASLTVAFLCPLVPFVDKHFSTEAAWCPGPCAVHSADPSDPGPQPVRLLRLLHSVSLDELVADKRQIVHLEAVRELHLRDQVIGAQFSQLILALYARTFPGPSISYLIRHQVLAPQAVTYPAIRSSLYALAATEGVDQTRLEPGPLPSLADLMESGDRYLRDAMEDDPSSPYLHLTAGRLAFRRFQYDGTTSASHTEKYGYLQLATAEADTALRDLPSSSRLVSSRRSPVSSLADVDTGPKDRTGPLSLPCLSVSSIQPQALSLLPDSLAMPLCVAANNALDAFNSYCLLEGKHCRRCTEGGCPFAQSLLALSRIHSYGPTSSIRRFTLILTATEHLAIDADHHRQAFLDAFAMLQSALADLPPSEHRLFVGYLRAGDPCFADQPWASSVVLRGIS